MITPVHVHIRGWKDKATPLQVDAAELTWDALEVMEDWDDFMNVYHGRSNMGVDLDGESRLDCDVILACDLLYRPAPLGRLLSTHHNLVQVLQFLLAGTSVLDRGMLIMAQSAAPAEFDNERCVRAI